MNREIRDLLCELVGVLWTLSAGTKSGFRDVAADYAERILNLLVEEDEGGEK